MHQSVADVERLLAAARETMAKVTDCLLATLAEDGSINSRVVVPIPAPTSDDVWTIWFSTHLGSRKAHEIRRNARLTIGYHHHPDRAYVVLKGRATIVEDRDVIRAGWRERFRPYFPGGPENPDTVFVRIEVERIELCVNGVTAEPFGSRHSALERGTDRQWKNVSG